MNVQEGSARRRLGSALLIVSVPVVAWWLIGDFSESPEADYFMLRPLAVTVGCERVFGALSFVVAVVGLALVVLAGEGRGPLSVWDRALLLTLGAEIGTAFVYRFSPPGSGARTSAAE